ncbi:MAG: PQQ-dependent sugar dehydrogenase [Ignavibacteria bacterium]|nr:PQQ-dependent sugar dehydrogenase [Ignavibacteria bacterium]
MIPIIFSLLVLFSCSKPEPQNNSTKKDPPKVTESAGNISDDYKIEVFAENLTVPWSIAWTDKDRMLVNERTGKIRIIQNGKLQDSPLLEVKEVSIGSEEGLMGLAVDPNYADNKFIYISYAYGKGDNLSIKVARYKDNGNSVSDELILIDKLPGAKNHAGCRLRFGPDGKLYITTGDATDREIAQDLKNMGGKILRLNSDGSIPSDNPWSNSPVWTYGHRNPQGIDFYPGTSILWETEHGPSGFDGPGGGDEVNVIVKGSNYGWPVVSHDGHKDGMIDPVLIYTPAEAPASGMFYKSGVISQFKNNFFFGCLRGKGIIRVVVDEKDPTKVISQNKMTDVDYGRIREIAEGPDGAIYFSTSNKDGRGNPGQTDDRIMRIVKK